MTISIGTFDDLQPDRPRPIDRTPLVACHDCGEQYDWNTWREWIDDPRETLLVCPDCQQVRVEAERLRARVERNHSITSFVEGGGDR